MFSMRVASLCLSLIIFSYLGSAQTWRKIQDLPPNITLTAPGSLVLNIDDYFQGSNLTFSADQCGQVTKPITQISSSVIDPVSVPLPLVFSSDASGRFTTFAYYLRASFLVDVVPHSVSDGTLGAKVTADLSQLAPANVKLVCFDVRKHPQAPLLVVDCQETDSTATPPTILNIWYTIDLVLVYDTVNLGATKRLNLLPNNPGFTALRSIRFFTDAGVAYPYIPSILQFSTIQSQSLIVVYTTSYSIATGLALTQGPTITPPQGIITTLRLYGNLAFLVLNDGSIWAQILTNTNSNPWVSLDFAGKLDTRYLFDVFVNQNNQTISLITATLSGLTEYTINTVNGFTLIGNPISYQNTILGSNVGGLVLTRTQLVAQILNGAAFTIAVLQRDLAVCSTCLLAGVPFSVLDQSIQVDVTSNRLYVYSAGKQIVHTLSHNQLTITPNGACITTISVLQNDVVIASATPIVVNLLSADNNIYAPASGPALNLNLPGKVTLPLGSYVYGSSLNYSFSPLNFTPYVCSSTLFQQENLTIQLQNDQYPAGFTEIVHSALIAQSGLGSSDKEAFVLALQKKNPVTPPTFGPVALYTCLTQKIAGSDNEALVCTNTVLATSPNAQVLAIRLEQSVAIVKLLDSANALTWYQLFTIDKLIWGPKLAQNTSPLDECFDATVFTAFRRTLFACSQRLGARIVAYDLAATDFSSPQFKIDVNDVPTTLQLIFKGPLYFAVNQVDNATMYVGGSTSNIFVFGISLADGNFSRYLTVLSLNNINVRGLIHTPSNRLFAVSDSTTNSITELDVGDPLNIRNVRSYTFNTFYNVNDTFADNQIQVSLNDFALKVSNAKNAAKNETFLFFRASETSANFLKASFVLPSSFKTSGATLTPSFHYILSTDGQNFSASRIARYPTLTLSFCQQDGSPVIQSSVGPVQTTVTNIYGGLAQLPATAILINAGVISSVNSKTSFSLDENKTDNSFSTDLTLDTLISAGHVTTVVLNCENASDCESNITFIPPLTAQLFDTKIVNDIIIDINGNRAASTNGATKFGVLTQSTLSVYTRNGTTTSLIGSLDLKAAAPGITPSKVQISNDTSYAVILGADATGAQSLIFVSISANAVNALNTETIVASSAIRKIRLSRSNLFVLYKNVATAGDVIDVYLLTKTAGTGTIKPTLVTSINNSTFGLNALTVADFGADVNQTDGWVVSLVTQKSSIIYLFNYISSVVAPQTFIVDLKTILASTQVDKYYPNDLEITSVLVSGLGSQIAVFTRNYHHFVLNYTWNATLTVGATIVKYGDFENVGVLPSLSAHSLLLIYKSTDKSDTNLYCIGYTDIDQGARAYARFEYLFAKDTNLVGLSDEEVDEAFYWTFRCQQGSQYQSCASNNTFGSYSYALSQRLVVGNQTQSNWVDVQLSTRFQTLTVRIDILRITEKVKSYLMYILGGVGIVAVLVVGLVVFCIRKIAEKKKEDNDFTTRLTKD